MTCTKAEWSALKTAVAAACALDSNLPTFLTSPQKADLVTAGLVLCNATITDNALQTPGEIVENTAPKEVA